jgi:DNA-binding CsgD family transcriptional regulator/tetratricopeptide (TPR) repeat protein
MLMAGRVEERLLLERTLEAAATGVPGAVLVHGEAGVGKTRLVSQVCADARARGFTTIWGSCVRVGSIEAPYHPLVKGLEAWAHDAGEADRAAVLGPFGSVEELLGTPERKEATGLAGRLVAIERLVETIAQRVPTILVLDDLQWADLASRDVLAYLVAGFHRQRLAIVCTYRDEGLRHEEVFHGWLADVSRLPAVADLGLQRLTAAETEEQVNLLRGGTADPVLVADLVQRAQGNPYFTELLVKGLPPGAEGLPSGVPQALTQALLAAWHRLDRRTREVLTVLALAGRPASAEALSQVVTELAADPASCVPALREAEDAGIVVREGQHHFWFRHPLLVEVLEATMTTTEARPVHAAWAHCIEGLAPSAVDELTRQSDLARHHEASGDAAASIEASLRAADLAEAIGAVREVAAHLKRVVRLGTPDVDLPDLQDQVALLERTARACERVGDAPAALSAWSAALELTDTGAEPQRASRLVIACGNASWRAGVRKDKPIAEMARAVALGSGAPDSEEYAIALSELSMSESWSGLKEEGVSHADEAIGVAQRSGSAAALARAHLSLAHALGRGRAAESATVVAIASATESGDGTLLAHAHMIRLNVVYQHGRLDAAVAEALEALRAARLGGDLSEAAFAAGALGGLLLALGRLPEAAEVVREALSLPGVPNSAARARLAAMQLAVRRGDLAAAELHAGRARELIPELEERPGLEAPPMLAEQLIANRRPDEALALLSRTLEAHFVDPLVADEMLVWAARAAAGCVERATDLRDAEAATRARAALTEFRERRDRLAVPAFEPGSDDDATQPAMRALFDAERQRCEEGVAPASAWALAVEACEAAGMRWEAEVSRWRLAQGLSREGARSSVVAEQLRAVHRFAVGAGAVPLDRQVGELAQAGGIRLEEPQLPAQEAPAAGPLATLTLREREVLAHLVAGRTYSEIASALVISEKTVSSHVSHLLSKTDTRSRRDLAALVQRLDAHDPR